MKKTGFGEFSQHEKMLDWKDKHPGLRWIIDSANNLLEYPKVSSKVALLVLSFLVPASKFSQKEDSSTNSTSSLVQNVDVQGDSTGTSTTQTSSEYSNVVNMVLDPVLLESYRKKKDQVCEGREEGN